MQSRQENNLLKKISKSVVAFYKISPPVYQGWIETYLEQADNQTKLINFREELRKLILQERDALPEDFTKEKCLEYAKKLHAKIAVPKADLLIRQARNMTTKEVPWSVFGHQANQELAHH